LITSEYRASGPQQGTYDICAACVQGYGLAWSGFREGYLLSGSDDAQICLWDINAANSKMLGAMAIYHQHLGVVEVILLPIDESIRDDPSLWQYLQQARLHPRFGARQYEGSRASEHSEVCNQQHLMQLLSHLKATVGCMNILGEACPIIIHAGCGVAQQA
jgi:hypothetical protein